MSLHSRTFWAACGLLVINSSMCFGADQPAANANAVPLKAIRLERDAKDVPVALQTAVLEFKALKPEEAGVTVDLVGAVHVGDKSYYEQLNKAFEDYDAVLYEMVMPEGAKFPKGGAASNHPVAVLQNGMKDALHLEHQLALIDYTKQNLVHADMSPERFAKSMQDRGESVWQYMFRAMSQSMAKQSKKQKAGGEMDLLMALFEPSGSLTLKRALAEQFADLEGLIDAFEGPKGSTLISERNKVALEELARQIAAGKKHIAIFYGAGHLPDMSRRLVADYGMQQSGERWLTAWDLHTPGKRKAAARANPKQPQQPASEAAATPAQ